MARGFRCIDEELGWPGPPGWIGDFVQIDFGHRTGGALVAEYTGPDQALWVLVEDPVSYRVHDERELVAYWTQRAEENAPIAFAYELEESAYLIELREGVSGMIGTPLRHFLMGGQNACLEVIARNLPTITSSRPGP